VLGHRKERPGEEVVDRAIAWLDGAKRDQHHHWEDQRKLDERGTAGLAE
jgi:hypothetical protein